MTLPLDADLAGLAGCTTSTTVLSIDLCVGTLADTVRFTGGTRAGTFAANFVGWAGFTASATVRGTGLKIDALATADALARRTRELALPGNTELTCGTRLAATSAMF